MAPALGSVAASAEASRDIGPAAESVLGAGDPRKSAPTAIELAYIHVLSCVVCAAKKIEADSEQLHVIGTSALLYSSACKVAMVHEGYSFWEPQMATCLKARVE